MEKSERKGKVRDDDEEGEKVDCDSARKGEREESKLHFLFSRCLRSLRLLSRVPAGLSLTSFDLLITSLASLSLTLFLSFCEVARSLAPSFSPALHKDLTVHSLCFHFSSSAAAASESRSRSSVAVGIMSDGSRRSRLAPRQQRQEAHCATHAHSRILSLNHE